MGVEEEGVGCGRARGEEVLILIYFLQKQATLPLTEKPEDTPDDKKQARQFGF